MNTKGKRISMLENMMEEQKNRQQNLNERMLRIEKMLDKLDQTAYRFAIRINDIEKAIEDME